MKRVLVIAVVALLGGNVAAAYALSTRSTPVDVETAVERFRSEAATTAVGGVMRPAEVAVAPVLDAAPSVSGGPTVSPRDDGSRKAETVATSAGEVRAVAAGVYVYATQGFEEVSVLGGSRHTYPPQTTVTVRPTSCGDDVRWDGLQQRWDEWRTCAAGGATQLRSLETYHEFFAQVDRRTYACTDGTVLRPAGTVPGTTVRGSCSSGEATADITAVVTGVEAVTIERRAVDAVRVRLDERLTGATKGTRTSDSWYRVQDGLLLRRTAVTDADTKATFGFTHYREELSMTLASLTPRR